MKKYLAVYFVVLLSACATVHETYAPDGRKAYALNCSGTARGWDKCRQAAGEKCGVAGYDVIEMSTEDVSSISGGSSASLTNASSGFYGVKTNERSMLVACKVHKGKKSED